jgi:hypothetical protein
LSSVSSTYLKYIKVKKNDKKTKGMKRITFFSYSILIDGHDVSFLCQITTPKKHLPHSPFDRCAHAAPDILDIA